MILDCKNIQKLSYHELAEKERGAHRSKLARALPGRRAKWQPIKLDYLHFSHSLRNGSFLFLILRLRVLANTSGPLRHELRSNTNTKLHEEMIANARQTRSRQHSRLIINSMLRRLLH